MLAQDTRRMLPLLRAATSAVPLYITVRSLPPPRPTHILLHLCADPSFSSGLASI